MMLSNFLHADGERIFRPL